MEPPALSEAEQRLLDYYKARYVGGPSTVRIDGFREGLIAARRAASGSLPGGERSVREAYEDWQAQHQGADPLGEWQAFYAGVTVAWEAMNAKAPPPPAAEPVVWALMLVEGTIPAGLTRATRAEVENEARMEWGHASGWRAVPLYTAPQPGGVEAKELRAALDAVLATSGARGTYHALKYGDAVERAERLLAPPPGDAQEDGR